MADTEDRPKPPDSEDRRKSADTEDRPLRRRVLSSCPRPNCGTCHPDRGRAATGELGYHGQEGYKTRLYDAGRAEDLPTADENHPDHDPAWPDGYETPSTGFLQVGARDYDPDLGRWLQPDPEPVGPELQWGQNNRWAYCANDPVNASDPTGRLSGWDFFAIAITLGIVMTGVIMMASGLPLQGLAMILGALEFLLDWFADQATDCIERLRMHAIASTLYGLAFALLSGGLLFASSLPAILGTLGGALVALRGFGLEIRDLTNDVSTAGGSFW